MEDIKGITQETADEMLRAFQSFNESAEDFRAAFDASMEVYMERCLLAAAQGRHSAYQHEAVLLG